MDRQMSGCEPSRSIPTLILPRRPRVALVQGDRLYSARSHDTEVSRMPYGGNDWLALTQEPTLEPEIPICDPHHHFWDLRPERIPYQRYLLHELTADVTRGHNVRSTVFIETRGMYRPDGPVEMRAAGEVE